MRGLSQTLFLALTDLRRHLGSPHSAISFVGSIVFVGFLFWLLAGYRIDHFLNATLLWMPILLLAPATAAITSDREAGYAGILFTYPVTATRYYAAKFLALHLLLAVHLLVLTPYFLLILVYGGSAWLGDMGKFAAWAILETSFVSALGLFLSASFGRRAAMASAYIGFGLALVFIIGPWFSPFYIATLPPETASLFLRILHFSPLMAALDETGTGYFVAVNPVPSLLATVSVIAFLVTLGLFVYRRFQSAEGWEVGRAKAAPVVALGILLLLAVPMIPDVSYTALPSGGSSQGCIQTATIQYCVGFRPTSPNQLAEWAVLSSRMDVQIVVDVHNEQPNNLTVGKIAVEWFSRFIDFNATRAEFGPVDVPATSGLSFIMNLTAVPVRVPNLQQSAGFFGYAFTPVPVRLTADGTFMHFDIAIAVAAPLYERNIVWIVVGLEAALVLGRRLTRRSRKGSP